MAEEKHDYETIYLQTWMDEISWCWDRIDGPNDEKDVEYVRADLVESLRSELAARDEEIATLSARCVDDRRRESDLLNSLEAMESRAEEAETKLAARDKRVRELEVNPEIGPSDAAIVFGDDGEMSILIPDAEEQGDPSIKVLMIAILFSGDESVSGILETLNDIALKSVDEPARAKED